MLREILCNNNQNTFFPYLARNCVQRLLSLPANCRYTMRSSPLVIFSFILIIAPKIAIACEGQCITGVTNAFVQNYTNPVHIAIRHAVSLRSTQYTGCPCRSHRVLGQQIGLSMLPEHEYGAKHRVIAFGTYQHRVRFFGDRANAKSYISFLFPWKMPTPRFKRTARESTWMPESRLSCCMRHARIHGPFLLRAADHRIHRDERFSTRSCKPWNSCV